MTKQITKKFIFEQKLKGEPIYVYVNGISNKEIQCLIDCGIVEQFSTWAPRKLNDLGLVTALYPIVNVITRRDLSNSDIIREECDYILPHGVVKLRIKSVSH